MKDIMFAEWGLTVSSVANDDSNWIDFFNQSVSAIKPKQRFFFHLNSMSHVFYFANERNQLIDLEILPIHTPSLPKIEQSVFLGSSTSCALRDRRTPRRLQKN